MGIDGRRRGAGREGHGKRSEGGEKRRRALAELEDGWATLRVTKRVAVDVSDVLPLPERVAIRGLALLRDIEASVWSEAELLGVVWTLSWVGFELDAAVAPDSMMTTDYSWDMLPRFLERYLSEVLGSIDSIYTVTGD